MGILSFLGISKSPAAPLSENERVLKEFRKTVPFPALARLKGAIAFLSTYENQLVKPFQENSVDIRGEWATIRKKGDLPRPLQNEFLRVQSDLKTLAKQLQNTILFIVEGAGDVPAQGISRTVHDHYVLFNKLLKQTIIALAAAARKEGKTALAEACNGLLRRFDEQMAPIAELHLQLLRLENSINKNL